MSAQRENCHYMARKPACRLKYICAILNKWNVYSGVLNKSDRRDDDHLDSPADFLLRSILFMYEFCCSTGQSSRCYSSCLYRKGVSWNQLTCCKSLVKGLHMLGLVMLPSVDMTSDGLLSSVAFAIQPKVLHNHKCLHSCSCAPWITQTQSVWLYVHVSAMRC